MTKSTRNDDRKNLENDNVEEAVEKIVTNVYRSLTPDLEHRLIIGQTLQLLSNGSPVTSDEIACQLQASPEKVTSTLRKFGAEFDKEGNILGLGLTLGYNSARLQSEWPQDVHMVLSRCISFPGHSRTDSPYRIF